MSHINTTLRAPRLIALALCQSLAVVVGGLCGRALVVLRDKQDMVSASMPQGELHGGDIVAVNSVLVGAVGVSAFIALAISAPLLLKRWRIPGITRPLLAASAVFCLAASIASTVVGATRSGRVTAAPSIPPSVVEALIKASGESLRYIDTTEVKAFIIVCWFQWLATSAAVVLEYAAARNPSADLRGVHSGIGKNFGGSADLDDKPSVSRQEA